MKKYAFTLLAILAIVISSCSKDDKTPTPDPNKVTRITCTKNGDPAFSMEVKYNTDATINSITYSNGVIDNLQYRSNEIYVINTNGDVRISYKLSGNKIETYEIKEINPFDPNEIYTYDEFVYKYSGNNWIQTTMKGSRPIDGNIVDYKSNVIHNFEWKSGCIASYSAGNNILEFDYDPDPNPTNYPFRIINNLALENGKLAGTFVSRESFSPMNLLMGNNNKYLVKSAKWFINPNINKNLAEYQFDYSTNSKGYVTKVDITETINDGNIEETNLYTINLSYDYNPNK